jgi:GNAT superfamily N-acetyltransferase
MISAIGLTKSDRNRSMQFVDLTLARRLELTHAHRSVEYARAQQRLCPHLGVNIEKIGSAWAVYAGPDSPVNAVRGLGLDGPAKHEELDRVIGFFRAQNALARVTVCPLADSSLMELLSRRCFQLQSFFSVLSMPTLASRDAASINPAIEVREIGPADKDLWLQTVAMGFAGDGPLEPTIGVIAPTLYSTSARSFLAWIEDEPAGGGTIIIHEGVAELCSASTLRTFRCRGVQTALVHARLLAAHQAGCDLAMVITSPAAPSQRNVERFGFRLAYTRPVVAASGG